MVIYGGIGPALLIGAFKQISATDATAAPAAEGLAPRTEFSSVSQQCGAPIQAEGEVLEATGNKLPLPAGAARFAEKVQAIAPAATETASVGTGIGIIVAGFVALMIGLAQGIAHTSAIGFYLFGGLIVLMVCLFFGV